MRQMCLIKKLFLYVMISSVIMSCTKNNEEDIPLSSYTLYGFTDNNQESKTGIEYNEGIGTIYWKPNDGISVFWDVMEGVNVKYRSTNTEDSPIVEFVPEVLMGIPDVANYDKWALYPYEESAISDEQSVVTIIHSDQQAVSGTFDTNLFPMLARSNSNELRFKNVCGGVKFSLSRDDIKKITFRGNNNEDLAGIVQISLNENGYPVSEVKGGIKKIILTPKEESTFAKNTNYYLVMLPVVLSKGFTMTFETESHLGTFEYTAKPVTIRRSAFSSKMNIDTYATFGNKPESEPFTITALSDGNVGIDKVGSPYTIRLEYRVENGDWNGYEIGTSVDLSEGESIQFRAVDKNSDLWNEDSDYYNVKATGDIKVSGNILSLSDKNCNEIRRNFGCLFKDCTKLKSAENLVFPDVVYYKRFNNMFKGCTGLTTAPELPAKEMAQQCYSDMFSGCTSLTTVPTLPATTLDKQCYSGMFSGCTSLTTAPELPATMLAEQCYSGMFSGCTSLIIAPELPASTLAVSCYSSMFSGCTGLTAIPELSATRMKRYCYSEMFKDCTGLTTEPELPATELAKGCYHQMFSGCTGLTTAPELPVTTLSDECYKQMFKGCTGLTTAPELPAVTLAQQCYSSMFEDCTKLITAPALPATVLANQCYYRMFFCCTSLTTVPERLPATTLADQCYYQMFSLCTSLTKAPELPATELRGKCYFEMFAGCTSLTTAPEELPAKEMAQQCYYRMFSDCVSLATAPKLPATTLADYCYFEMFSDCTSLTTAPELPAMALATSCYSEMFSGCTSLATVPDKLPATTLATSCYSDMFSGCTSLTKAPELSATQLTYSCFVKMFFGCSKLSYLKVNFTAWRTRWSGITTDWLSGVSSTGTFVCPSQLSYERGESDVPYGWQVETF